MTDITTRQALLSPVELGDLRLPNRVVMAPITRARAANDLLVPTELHAAYYGQRATAGLIVTEGTWISERAISFDDVPGIYREEQVTAWRRVTDVVHALGGRIVLQLWHGGPMTPDGMSTEDIEATIADFAAAAANARRAGFDGVEVHAVGPFLLPQFLNARVNHRTDVYGTDRGRLLFEVVDAVAGQWAGRCVGVRLSPYWSTTENFVPDEETLTAYDEYVTELNDHTVAYLHLRGSETDTPDVDSIDRYRRRFDGPLIANLGFDRESADAAIAAGSADAVSFATHYIANPDLVARFALGRELATGDPVTYYRGGAEGYVDYPESR
ncbi:N-ethylmaleimide reductase [Saccharothrix tamanrassetensis]|uniref:N-ethylmaleimide reductase n=1 Tax=Saccharothrix tamanrassetensis TaxID=1051531 RepID=A0A841CLJ5_9PSEU|nr:alkene reductase [Saccharothrix tamanrassetensis]MBB5957970.1 N-ethylmaleimide reductase [Saccharothrix tamanrassetensis]